MQIESKCPACGTDCYFFAGETAYEGPFQCFKCKTPFTLKVKNGKVEFSANLKIRKMTLPKRNNKSS